MIRLLSTISIFLVILSTNAELRGIIEFCSGWSLNKNPALKTFLNDKDGDGADSYENLDLVIIKGRPATLTIYDVPEANCSRGVGKREGWVEKEKIGLSGYKTKVSLI